MDIELGVLEIDTGLRPHCQHVSAQLAVDVDRGEREGLEGPPRGDPERREGPRPDDVVDRALQRLRGGARADGQGEIGDAADPVKPLSRRLRMLVTLEIEDDSPGPLDDRGGAEVAHRRFRSLAVAAKFGRTGRGAR